MKLLLCTAVLGIMLFGCSLSYPFNKCVLRRPCKPDLVCNSSVACHGGYLKPNASECGCCPACVRWLGRGDRCGDITIPPENECGEGLVCSEKSRTCVPPSNNHQTSPENSWVSCLKAPLKLATCSSDGTFSPRQCDTQFCYCVNPDGKRLPYKVSRNYASQMECICARVEYAVSTINKRKSPMCDKFGNYKQ